MLYCFHPRALLLRDLNARYIEKPLLNYTFRLSTEWWSLKQRARETSSMNSDVHRHQAHPPLAQVKKIFHERTIIEVLAWRKKNRYNMGLYLTKPFENARKHSFILGRNIVFYFFQTKFMDRKYKDNALALKLCALVLPLLNANFLTIHSVNVLSLEIIQSEVTNAAGL